MRKTKVKKDFDVFLIHKNKNNAWVEDIRQGLEQRDLKIKQSQLQDIKGEGLSTAKSVVIIFSTEEQENWEPEELNSLFEQCKEQNILVIPVLMPKVNELPSEWAFLKDWDSVNSIKTTSEVLDDLEVRIKGKSPSFLSPFIKFLINLLIMVMLFFLVKNKFLFLLPCVHSTIRALLLAIISLFYIHAIWRFLGPLIKRSGFEFQFGPVKISFELLVVLLDELHPWILPNCIIVSLWIISFLSFGFIHVYPPLKIRPNESMPKVENFSVKYLNDGSILSLKPGDEFEIILGEQVRVKAITNEQTVSRCIWSVVNGGTLQKSEGCSIFYGAPYGPISDVIEIQTHSPCKTQQDFATLCVRVVNTRQ